MEISNICFEQTVGLFKKGKKIGILLSHFLGDSMRI
jgi:hypothetical protein